MSHEVQNEEIGDGSAESGRRNGSGDRDNVFTATFVYQDETKNLRFRDAIVDGRKVLRSAGFEPPSDYVLIELQKPGSRSLGLDEEFDLRNARPTFRAFLSDRIFNFTIAERGYEWGAARISEPELRNLAAVSDGKVLVLERDNEPDDVIEPDQVIDLAERGTERIRIDKHPDTFEIKIIYDGLTKALKVSLSETMGDARNRALALFSGIESPHLLSLFDKHGVEMQDAQTVKDAKVRKGDKLLLRPSTVRAG